ncbi:efflux transporter outer membrane subunit [Xanthomonas indica]|uniref:Efflux transporter outer membrane subunit n=1 Tax=Xanthomonas indica TaxID=2912242 RepID=A0AAU8I0S2_9XANT|nr:efflux transporter outer membrane subunit [Xanthomonas indica]MCI2261903.1 efflux transporter outer membrane subunit [Xanthomonas indica]
MSRIRVCPAGVLALAAALALAGCASQPIPDLRQPSLPAQWSSATPQAAAPRPQGSAWWQDFHDPQLDALVAQALRDDLEVGQALARLRAARRLDAVADATLRPQLRARTEDPIDPDASASFLVVGVDSEWELPLFGRGEATNRVARGDLQSAQANLAQVRAATISDVAHNWIDLRHAQQAERLLQDIASARQRQAGLQQTLVDLHLAAPATAAQAQAAALQAQSAVNEPRDAAAAAARRLAVLLGRDTPDPAWSAAAATTAPGQLQIAAVDSVPADLLRRRPDIAAHEAEVISAAGALGIARADRYGSIGLGGAIRWSTSLLSHRRTATHGIASFGPVIDIPLFDWGIRQARAKARGDLLEAATLAYRQTVLDAVNEVETALTTLEQQRRNTETQQQVLQAQQQVAEVAQQRRRLGLGSDLDVATQQAARDQAALELLEAQRQRDLAYVALHTALGSATAPIPGAGDGSDRRGAQP